MLDEEIKQLDNTIKRQKKSLEYKTIPKKHLPKQLPYIHHPTDSQLNNKFYREYKTLYFKHLEKAIEANTITLQLKKARLQVEATNHHLHTNIQTTINTDDNSTSQSTSTFTDLDKQETPTKDKKEDTSQPNKGRKRKRHEENQQNKKQKTITDYFLAKHTRTPPNIT